MPRPGFVRILCSRRSRYYAHGVGGDGMRPGLYLGFPGIGKTPMAKEEPNVIDLDAGYVRKAIAEVAGIEIDSVDEAELVRFIAVLADLYIQEGWAVITNVPAVMDLMPVSKMFVQSPTAKRSIADSAAKMGVAPQVAQTYLEEWTLAAKAHNVPVVQLRKGIDYIFRQHRQRHFGNAVIVRPQDGRPREEVVEQSDEPNPEPKMGEFW